MSGAVPDTRITEEAATWLLRLQEASDEDTRQAFSTWLAADARHQREYAVLQGMWGGLERVGRPRRRRAGGAARLALVFLLGLGCAHALFHHDADIRTQVAETGRYVLADGTVVHLDVDSQLQVSYRFWGRQMTLVHGQAQFEVAPAWRPFAVKVLDSTVRDIGTTFNVRVRGESGWVSVQSGVVEVMRDERADMRRLEAGQHLHFVAGTDRLPPPVTQAGQPAWRDNRWVFEAAPLSEVLEDVNRYHRKPVELGDPQLAHYRVSGVFARDDRPGLLRALGQVFPLRVDEQGESTQLRRR